MANKSNQPAALRRKIERLEALLDAEREAHAKTFDAYRKTLYDAVDRKLKVERAMGALNGEDE